MKKNQSGVSLISLVITIIVLVMDVIFVFIKMLVIGLIYMRNILICLKKLVITNSSLEKVQKEFFAGMKNIILKIWLSLKIWKK